FNCVPDGSCQSGDNHGFTWYFTVNFDTSVDCVVYVPVVFCGDSVNAEPTVRICLPHFSTPPVRPVLLPILPPIAYAKEVTKVPEPMSSLNYSRDMNGCLVPNQ